MNRYKTLFIRWILILSVLVIISLACQVPEKASNNEKENLPDLVLDGWVSMDFGSLTWGVGNCVEEYGYLETTICVRNQGKTPAGEFTIYAGSELIESSDGLQVGEEICFNLGANPPGGTITVDTENDVKESDENNNDLGDLPIPTPPLLCTPVPEEGQVETTEPVQEPDIAYQGVSFSYSALWFETIAPETIPAEANVATESWNIPEHYLFSFNGYPLSDTFHEPQIMVFPVGAYTAINSVAGDTIDQLQQLLINKPSNPEEIPFLPVFNAGQFMQTKVKYIDFQNGSGVRFLTQYGQAAWPINNQDMFYAFQGLTNDGQYYISAILPVKHDDLPNPDEVTMDDAFYENFMDYVTGVEEQLNEQPDKMFVPALAAFDDMIQSIEVIGEN